MPSIVRDASGNPASVCIFCHRSATGRNYTSEHVLARKWRRKYGFGTPGLHLLAWYSKFSISGPIERVDEPRPADPAFSWTVQGTVCRDCNTGWMRRLEEASEPCLSDLFTGREVTLKPEELRIIENWTAKTALVLESRDQAAKAMSLPLAQTLMEAVKDDPGGQSPQGFFTWVHAVEPNRRHQMRTSVHTILRRDHKCTGHHFRVATIQIHGTRLLTTYTSDAVAYAAISEPSLGFMREHLISGLLTPWRLGRTPPIPLDRAMDDHEDLVELLTGQRMYPPGSLGSG